MMASVVAGGNRRESLTLRGVDPETCMIVFKNHWAQVVKILEKHEPGRAGTGVLGFLSGQAASGTAALRLGPIPADEASAVQNYVEHMLFLLMEEEAGQGGAMGPILEFVVLEGVMERLFLWSLRRHFTEDMKLEQLRMYQMLLSQAKQPLLHHKPVLRPLMMLLASCARGGADSSGVVEAQLVWLLNQLCVALVKDPSVLELFFHTSEDQGAANFLLFSLLIPYTHRQGLVGQQARDALLLIMSLSASEPRVAQHIAQNTYFCPVLATGLSGLYSSLPAKLQVYSEDWHFLEEANWQQVPALVHFLHSLDFCSTVTKVAHPSIKSQLLGYIYNGFLVPVLAPALHKLTIEEVMTTTAYLDLFLRSVSEPALLQTFLSFILLHTHDNVHILDTLVSRVNTPFQLGTVSLALFRTLIGLFCEDVMLQLVFRYLVPCRHLSARQLSSLRQTDSASSFLLLTPSWCPSLHLPHTHTEHIHWPQGAGQSVADRVAYRRGSDFLMDVNYLHYLWDARLAIYSAHRACRFWSALYDGMDPPPWENRSGTPGEDKEEMEDETERRVNSYSVCSSTATPPPSSALYPTPSSLVTVSTGNQTGRAASALELEWDDMFVDNDPDSSSAVATPPVRMGVSRGPNPPPPPQHIQEMRRSATVLVRGLYVEESEFQDDVLVYDLVAQRDAMLDRMAVNRDEEERVEKSPSLTNANELAPVTAVTNADDFLSQYRELMFSLGVEPDCDDITDDITTFRKRVRALRERQEEEGLEEEVDFNSVAADAEEEGKDEAVEEEEEGEEWKSNRMRGVPFTGPFISVLLSRLENLLENSISVNLLVTGILARLASYPQPLLRDFLLCTHTHYQPNTRTLYQVLVSVRAQIERYVSSKPDYPALLTQAWRFLLVKDQDSKIREHLQGDDITVGGSLPNGCVAPPPPPCPSIPPHARSGVFAIIVYAEFLKELAAIAQEHSIALDRSIEE
ncbi:LOW QUALITY PROTEIN: FHF complex subunit HOOK interacting protein 1Ab [Diretmus argenteus]